MLPTIAVAATTGSPHDKGRRPITTRERFEFGRMVEQSVHAHAKEVHHVHFDDRAQPRHRGRDARPEKGTLADGSATNACGPEAHEQVAPEQRNVLTEHDDARVVGHGLRQVHHRSPA